MEAVNKLVKSKVCIFFCAVKLMAVFQKPVIIFAILLVAHKCGEALFKKFLK